MFKQPRVSHANEVSPKLHYLRTSEMNMHTFWLCLLELSVGNEACTKLLIKSCLKIEYVANEHMMTIVNLWRCLLEIASYFIVSSELNFKNSTFNLQLVLIWKRNSKLILISTHFWFKLSRGNRCKRNFCSRIDLSLKTREEIAFCT